MHMFLFSCLESGSTLFHLSIFLFFIPHMPMTYLLYHLQGTDREETGCEQFSNAPSLHSKICNVRITPASVALMRESSGQYQRLQRESDAQWYTLLPGPWNITWQCQLLQSSSLGWSHCFCFGVSVLLPSSVSGSEVVWLSLLVQLLFSCFHYVFNYEFM